MSAEKRKKREPRWGAVRHGKAGSLLRAPPPPRPRSQDGSDDSGRGGHFLLGWMRRSPSRRGGDPTEHGPSPAAVSPRLARQPGFGAAARTPTRLRREVAPPAYRASPAAEGGGRVCRARNPGGVLRWPHGACGRPGGRRGRGSSGTAAGSSAAHCARPAFGEGSPLRKGRGEACRELGGPVWTARRRREFVETPQAPVGWWSGAL